MAKGTWGFVSTVSWDQFARSFQTHMNRWRGPFGSRIEFIEAGTQSGNPFAGANRAGGLQFDVAASPVVMGNSAASFVRLTPHERDGRTEGVIDFFQPLGAAGKDLADASKRAVLAVDPTVQFARR